MIYAILKKETGLSSYIHHDKTEDFDELGKHNHSLVQFGADRWTETIYA